MFRTRQAPPTGRPPPYAVVNRMTKRNLKPLVVLFGVMGCLWALVWAYDAFRDIPDHQSTISAFVPFDIVLGVLYIVIALIEGFGVTAAILSRLPLVKIYAFLSVFGVIAVVAIEIIRLVLNNVYKKAIIDECVKEVRGLTVTTTTGSLFNPTTSSTTLNDGQAKDLCNEWWVKSIWRNVGWMVVALILGIMFALVNIAYYRQLADPALLRTQAPSTAYRMEATRYGNNQPYSDDQNIPGYNPYVSQSYANYVPAYNGRNEAYAAPPGDIDSKPPGYSSAPGYEAFGQGDEKAGYTGGATGANSNPFNDPPANNATGYLAPSGPPPGLGPHERSDRDEGFDPKMLEAVMKASETETRGNSARAGTNGEGSGAAFK